MVDQGNVGGAAPADQGIESALVAARRLTGLVRTLTPLLAQLSDLERALREFAHDTRDTFAVADAGVLPEPRAPAPAASPPADGRAIPEPSASASAAGASASSPAARTVPGGMVTLTVSARQGPLDLSRVHRAVESVPGITGLVVTSYTRGRAEFLLNVAPDAVALPLAEALTAAFPHGVDADWRSENAFDAVVRTES